MRIWKKERGLLSLEACVSVTIFIFLMLFMYSFFVVFEARNRIGHAILATANSMSLDIYENSIEGDKNTIRGVLRGFYGDLGDGGTDFTDIRLWNDGAVTTDDGGNSVLSNDFSDVIRRRFLAYLGAGDSEYAGKLLEKYHIRDGADGLDFSASSVSGSDLYLSVRYTIDYEFQVFSLDGLNMEQKCCSRLWKD